MPAELPLGAEHETFAVVTAGETPVADHGIAIDGLAATQNWQRADVLLQVDLGETVTGEVKPFDKNQFKRNAPKKWSAAWTVTTPYTWSLLDRRSGFERDGDGKHEDGFTLRNELEFDEPQQAVELGKLAAGSGDHEAHRAAAQKVALQELNGALQRVIQPQERTFELEIASGSEIVPRLSEPYRILDEALTPANAERALALYQAIGVGHVDPETGGPATEENFAVRYGQAACYFVMERYVDAYVWSLRAQRGVNEGVEESSFEMSFTGQFDPEGLASRMREVLATLINRNGLEPERKAAVEAYYAE
jgi:hypothetical protein